MAFMQIPNTFSIFPVKDKQPLVKWGEYSKKRHTLDDRLEWENKFGTNHQWGIATGKVSKIIVLDDDGGLNTQTHPIQRTWTAKTPRGGTHYYFKWIDALDSKVTTKTGVLPKVDTRGEGGYVVHYGFEKPTSIVPLASPPQWLIDLLPNKHEEVHPVSNILGNLEGIKEGNRNDSFTRLAGSLRARGYKTEEMFEFLLPKAKEVNFAEEELKIICNSVGRYPPKFEINDIEDNTKFSFVVSEKLRTEWIVEPYLLSKQSISFMAGLPSSRKTWLLMDLALSLASGTKWLNMFQCKKSKVLYLDQERPRASTVERFNGLLLGRDIDSKDLDDNLMLRPQSRVKLDLPNSFASFERRLEAFRPDFVLVDSFKKFHSRNELSSQDMQFIFTKLEELKDKFGCSFMFIHHETKGVIQKRKETFDVRAEDAAGTIDLQQTAEHFFNVLKSDDGSTLYHTKNNLGATISPILVKVEDMTKNIGEKIKVEGY